MACDRGRVRVPRRTNAGATGNRNVLHRTPKRVFDLGIQVVPRPEPDERDERPSRALILVEVTYGLVCR